jgi:hypothetical protein
MQNNFQSSKNILILKLQKNVLPFILNWRIKLKLIISNSILRSLPLFNFIKTYQNIGIASLK